MDERSAETITVLAYVAFLAFVAWQLWRLFQRLAPPVREPARVFRLVPAEVDDAPDAPAPAEPAPDRPKKKGH